jgi:PKD repeat protein
MLVGEVFEAWLFPDPASPLEQLYNSPGWLANGENITKGIINVSIVTGNEIYEGPQQGIETGQFTIISRNPNLDPKINPNLKYNSAIIFYDKRTGEFFRGYVTDVQVEYQRKDDPIITITGTDIFGAMQRVVISQDTHDSIMALSTGPEWNGLTFDEFIPYMDDFTSKYLVTNGWDGAGISHGFWFNASLGFSELPVGDLAYSPAKYIPQVGESYLEVVNKYAQTNLTFFNERGVLGAGVRDFDFIGVTPFVKYDPNFWDPESDPSLYPYYDFSSDPEVNRPYRSILIDNGYNRVVNQVDISNESRNVDAGELNSVSENFTRTSAESIEEYAISRASVSTIYPTNDEFPISSWANKYSTNIFQITQFPGQEIQQITFDNARGIGEYSYSFIPVNSPIKIKHEINNSQTIDGTYDVAGITHNISPDDWEMTFTFKPSHQNVVFNYQGQLPTIQMNAIEGDSNFNFTATLIDYDPDSVENVIWALSATDADQIRYIYPYAKYGNMFKNGIPRTGITQTWNFDDDGILAPYSFDPDSTYQAPTDNRYGGYGSGIWFVYAFITLTNGFTAVLQQEITVGTPAVEADFGWTQNLINNFGQVSFTDTSVNHETGESDSYLWDFGDGTTSAERNPIHVYNPGPTDTEYDVSLTVYAFGAGEEKIYSTHTETVTLQQPTMNADFTTSILYSTVTFTNTSTNVGFEEPDAYFWDFGDGTTSTEKNPVHIFPVTDVNTPQSFSVTLTTRNIWEQTDSVTKTVTTTALNKTGTFPVRYIKFKIDQYQKSGTIPSGGELIALNPVMSYLRAITSNTGENLSYLKPLIGFNDSSIPRMRWFATNGGAVQVSNGYEYFLTRNPQGLNTAYYGDGPANQNNGTQAGLAYPIVRWELVVDLGAPTQLINDILLRFEDLLVLSGTFAGIHTETFYPKISVQFATTIGSVTANPSGVYGPGTREGDWVDVGYIKLDGGHVDPSVPQFPVETRTSATKTMSKIRPLPLNIPYFTYQFNPFGTNDKQVRFDSVETADSYLWTFGTGATSTSKTPLYTYPSYGTYNVTLEVTNGGVVTRTTTEPVIVQATII